jgi:hypothetical protein
VPFGKSSPISSKRSSGTGGIAGVGNAQDEGDHGAGEEAHAEAAERSQIVIRFTTPKFMCRPSHDDELRRIKLVREK